ncbi:hypothetical protein JR316_0005433 [Psilocybe cubensis]|uniref:Uncharacterized protein n=2 Tax=Psilocybe cubensis TaxID=181762 RepID=A0ACB8H6R3_PSICU|nr:hypothetical protein JR316_0005433 [Psilocybe cubensis]KAH9483327.1 hypothetical protein JR316_0005433 [Psilocybe cubensis]
MLACERQHAMRYRLAILVFFFVLSFFLAVSMSVGFLFELLDGSKGRILQYWIYSVFWFGYLGKVNTKEPMAETDVVSWYGLKGGEHCLRYSTREYTAKLTVGPSMDTIGQEGMIQLCKETPTVIHNRKLFTDFCQDLGFGRGVWGYWIVDFQEDDCETKWGEFIDLGCGYLNGGQQDHFRRVESHLENLQAGSSWQIMCATTPADIDGHHFGGPDRCHSLPQQGIYGIWDLLDGSCERKTTGP